MNSSEVPSRGIRLLQEWKKNRKGRRTKEEKNLALFSVQNQPDVAKWMEFIPTRVTTWFGGSLITSVDDLLPGSSAKGYVGSHTLGNLDHVEVFLETVDCNTIPTTVMDCIALRRGVKPFLLKTYTEKDPTTGCNTTHVGGLLSAGPPFTPEMWKWSMDRVMETAGTWKKDCDFLFNSFAQSSPVATAEIYWWTDIVQNRIKTTRLYGGDYYCSFCVEDPPKIFKTEKKLYDHYQSESHCSRKSGIICIVCREFVETWSRFVHHIITKHLVVKYHLGGLCQLSQLLAKPPTDTTTIMMNMMESKPVQRVIWIRNFDANGFDTSLVDDGNIEMSVTTKD